MCVCVFFLNPCRDGNANFQLASSGLLTTGEAMRSHPEEPGSGQMWGALSCFDLGGVLLM